MEYVYLKITTKDLKSQLSHLLHEKYITQYKIGQYVFPQNRNSRLFVWGIPREELPSNRLGLSQTEKIFLCEVKNPKPLGDFLSITHLPFDEVLDSFWQNYQIGNFHSGKLTFLCDAIKLVKEIKL